MRSQECDFIDVLILACVNQDDDLMDKAKMHPQLNYIDKELQKIVKNLSLFELLESGVPVPSPDTREDTSKNKLFGKKNVEMDESPIEEDQETLQLREDLNNLNVTDFQEGDDGDDDKIEEKNDEDDDDGLDLS